MDLIDRYEAQARGLKRYFTGQPCFRGHITERYTSNGACVACQNFTTPKKHGAAGFTFLPERALNFSNAEGAVPTALEAQAAYRYLEAAGWHLEALKAVRADPAVMARFDHERTLAEKFEAGR